MNRVCVYGVVKNGQVVLEVPLADGTVVAVTAAEPHIPAVWPEAEKRKLLAAINRMDLIDDPDWQVKCEADRIATTEKLILETVAMRAARAASADPQATGTPTARVQ